MKPEKIVSAQIVLPAASGAHPGPQTRITSENIQKWTPSAEAVERVSKKLQNNGFEVGGCVGNSFSITGPARLFESYFQTKLQEDRRGGLKFAGDDYELPKQKIPAALRGEIAAVMFTPPPDFGPGTGSFS